MTMFRQGDVLLRKVDRTPTKRHRIVPRDGGRVVLAYGEETGHAHAIYDQVAKLFAGAGERLLTAEKPVTLRHEEHDSIELPAGTYEVIQQREYDPGQGSRSVAD